MKVTLRTVVTALTLIGVAGVAVADEAVMQVETSIEASAPAAASEAPADAAVEAVAVESVEKPMAAAAQPSPVGLWKTFTDDGKTANGLIRITEKGGVFTATVEKSLKKETDSKVCEICPGDRKGQPFIGMEIMRGVTYNAENERWDGGEILDPENGKEYRVSLKLLENGQNLEVTGHLFVFSRSQVWERQ